MRNEICCEKLLLASEKNGSALIYRPELREFGVEYTDGTSSRQLINYCPWCGSKLPPSLCELWFAELEKMGFEDPWIDDDIPEVFKSEKWWKDRNL